MIPTNNARHNFAIKVLGKLPGLFQPQRYSYYCVRCKWSFLVNHGKRGTIAALDEAGKAFVGSEAAERIATFAIGPCPALKILSLVPPRPEFSISINGATNGASNGATNGATPTPIEQHRRRATRRVNSYLS